MAHNCETCDKNFTLKKDLKRHYKSLHHNQTYRELVKKLKIYYCSTCDLSFIRKDSLQRHYKSLLHIKNMEEDQKKQENTKMEIQNLFSKTADNIAFMFLNHKILPSLMKEKSVGSNLERHECTTLEKQDWVYKEFEEMVNRLMKEGQFIYHLAYAQLKGQFSENELKSALLPFPDPNIIYKSPTWMRSMELRFYDQEFIEIIHYL